MIYTILYRQSNEIITLEWVASRHWSLDYITNAFQRRYPNAELLSIAPKP